MGPPQWWLGLWLMRWHSFQIWIEMKFGSSFGIRPSIPGIEERKFKPMVRGHSMLIF